MPFPSGRACAALCVVGAGLMWIDPSLQAQSLQAQSSNAQSSGPSHGTRVGAHNCYEEEGKYADRSERALRAGTPLAIEQDLVWYTDPVTGHSRSLISHGKGPWINGNEPGLKEYFFERVRPLVERELKDPHPEQWPAITLFLDIKTNEREHLESIWETVAEYRTWLTTAPKAESEARQPLTRGPIEVFALSDVLSPIYGTGRGAESTVAQARAQRMVFYDRLRAGEKLLIFGAAPSNFDARDLSEAEASAALAGIAPESLLLQGATNYQRFWISSWDAVEVGGREVRASGRRERRRGLRG